MLDSYSEDESEESSGSSGASDRAMFPKATPRLLSGRICVAGLEPTLIATEAMLLSLGTVGILKFPSSLDLSGIFSFLILGLLGPFLASFCPLSYSLIIASWIPMSSSSGSIPAFPHSQGSIVFPLSREVPDSSVSLN